MGLFQDWEDDEFSKTLTNVIAGIVLLASILLFLSGTVETGIFYYLAFSALVVLGINNIKQAPHAFFGSRNKFYLSYIIGLIIAGYLGMQARAGATGLVLQTQSLTLPSDLLSFLFINIIAPIVEPLFWRGFIYPVVLAFFSGYFKNKNNYVAIVLAVLVSAYSFGFYHVYAYYGATGDILQTFTQASYAAMFGMLFIAGTTLLGSIGLEYGWHFVNNLFAQGYDIMQIAPTIAVFTLVLVVIVEAIHKRSK